MTTTRRRTTSLGEASLPNNDAQREPEHLISSVRSLLAEAQALSSRLAALNEIAVAMQTSIDTNAMLRVMARQARWVLDFQQCVVVTRQRTGYKLHVLLGTPLPEHSPIDALTARAIREGHATLAGSLTEHDGGPPDMQSALVLPLRDANVVIGTLNFYSRMPNAYNQNDLRIVSALALQVAAILQNQRLLTDMQRARDELHTILESIDNGVLVIDLNGRIVMINGALRRLLGTPDHTFVGDRALALLRWTLDHRQPLLERAVVHELWQRIQHPSAVPSDDIAPVDQTLALSDGRSLEWASARLVEAGATNGYVITVRDVSARVQLEQMRDDLTQMLVHDLRSPLTSVLMGLEMLERGPRSDDQAMYNSTLGHVQTAAQRLLEQINTLLDVNKLEAHQFELDLALCNARMLVELVTTPLLPLAQHSQKTIQIAVDETLPFFVCDAKLVQRVLQNLLDNALKFTPWGGIICIGARTDSIQNIIEFTVQDNGPGVPKDKRKHIFDKYGQARHNDYWRGTGLGLTFCKLVVEAHQGQIGVRDAPDGGSEFWFTLPLHTTARSLRGAHYADAMPVSYAGVP